ncbi:MAG: hypothetical protein KGN32_08185 [Burkholderiales bacterium]|nr:hypothetical protein [Burkholderiales bacterium]
MDAMEKDDAAKERAYQLLQERREMLAKAIADKPHRIEAGKRALDRLLTLAETRQSGQIKRIALFIGACWHGPRHFDFFDFRSLDLEIQEDMFAVLLAHATGHVDIDYMLPDAHVRIVHMLDRWGMYGPDQTGQPIVTRHCE